MSFYRLHSDSGSEIEEDEESEDSDIELPPISVRSPPKAPKVAERWQVLGSPPNPKPPGLPPASPITSNVSSS